MRGVSAGWISAEMGHIGRLDPIVSYCCSGQTGFYALGRWLVTDCKGDMDGLDGTLVGRGWDGLTLAGARTGAPPLAPEQERHHWLLRGGGRWEVVAVTNFFGTARGANYLCQSSKIIQIDCRQIGTSTWYKIV